MSLPRLLVPATLALALLAASLLAASTLPTIGTTGIVRGRIVVAPDRHPETRAIVSVLRSHRTVRTDEQGRFVAQLVPPGTYLLQVQVPGARTVCREIEVALGENDVGDILVEHPDEFDPDSIAIGSRAAVAARELEASIRPVKPRIRVGEGPEFRVRIRNRGSAPVLFVQSVDASHVWASPRVSVEIEGPADGFVVPQVLRCGNINGVRAADFVEIDAGAEFDPYAGGWLGSTLTRGRFTKPGSYTATFRYVTKETDPCRWVGGPGPTCDLSESLRDLIEQVPAVELTATTTFEVVM